MLKCSRVTSRSDPPHRRRRHALGEQHLLRASHHLLHLLPRPPRPHRRRGPRPPQPRRARHHRRPGLRPAELPRSLVTCFEQLTDAPVTPEKHDRIVSFAQSIADQEIELLPDVADTLADLATRHRLILVTKGTPSSSTDKLRPLRSRSPLRSPSKSSPRSTRRPISRSSSTTPVKPPAPG